MIKTCLAVCIAIFLVHTSPAQVKCIVESIHLQTTYAGGCKNGKAQGQGKASGRDTYEGNFKNGLPDGKGTYTFSDGYYVGSFKKGLRSGQGELHIFEEGRDSILVGFWDKDQYIGEYPTPYIIHTRSVGITKVDVREQKGDKGRIGILSQPQRKTIFIKPQPVTSLSVSEGSYVNEHKVLTEFLATTRLEGVTFPFRAIISFGNHLLEIEFLRNAAWEIEVVIGRE